MKSLLVAGITAFAVTPMLAKPPHGGKHGTDILHFDIHEAMTNDGIEQGATGSVTANENEQGNANNQTLDVVVSGLTPGTNYDLTAITNGSSVTTDLGTFTTDAKGKAAVHLTGLGKGHGGGKKSTALPDGFDISQVLELDVVNAGTQPVLTVDTTAPTSLKYLVKQDISNGGVSALLQIKASSKKTQFSLDVSGLNDSTDYQLVFNGAVVQTNTSDAHGHLKINSAPTPANILDLQSVALWDMSNTVIVTTTTPLP
jgi:hypothetical protein